MEPEFDLNQPIYLQIIQRICSQIMRGDYHPGDKLPSLVDAGLQFNVNHNTIARVYMEMARQGIVESRRGEGTFVTEDRAVLDGMHLSMRDSLMENFFSEMGRLGYSTVEISASFQEYIERKSQGSKTIEEGNS
jgi:GntR family transcriptional regulator